MRKLVLFFCSAIFAMTTFAQSKVNVILQDDSSTSHIIENTGKIYFSDDNIYVQDASGDVFTYPIANVHKLTFVTVTTDVVAPSSDGSDMAITPNPARSYIKISGITDGTPYVIYSVHGQMIKSGIANALDEIDVEALPAGFYFIRINNEAIKFCKL